MKWRTSSEKYEPWHDWYAWYPVKVRIGNWHRYVWLETISRRGRYICSMVAPLMYKDIWRWEYKIK